MKKLTIAAAMVCAAAMSYGAAANWNVGAEEIHDGTGSSKSTAYYYGLAYVFDSGAMSQSALFDLFAANTASFNPTAQTGYMAQGTVEEGSFTSANFSNGEQGDGKTYNYNFALFEDEMVYFSNIEDGEPFTTTAAKPISLGDQYDGASGDDSVSLSVGEGYAGAGKWSAVPEPFSGFSRASRHPPTLKLRRTGGCDRPPPQDSAYAEATADREEDEEGVRRRSVLP